MPELRREDGIEMKCAECQFFKIVQEPLRYGGAIWDWGMARCEKHDMVVDFKDRRKINKLTCVEETYGGEPT